MAIELSETLHTETPPEKVKPEEAQPVQTLDTSNETEIGKRIVQRAQGQQPSKTETPPEKEKPPVETAPAQAPLLVTDEMVKDVPALKSLVGKPIEELTKAYANLNKEYGRSQTELTTLKKKPEAPAVQETQKITQSGEKTIEQQIEELIDKSDLPDPIDDQKAYNKAFAKLQMKIADLKIKEAQKPLTEQFDKQRAVEQVRQQHDTTVNLIKEGVGKDVDIDSLMGQFTESMQPVLSEHPNLYLGKPEFLASDIIRFHLANQVKKMNDDLAATKAELESVKAGKQPTVKSVMEKIAGAPTGNQKPSVVQKEKTLTSAQEMENKITKRVVGEEYY